MGYSRGSGRGYLSGGFGHASISDDGNGNIVVKDDKQVLLPNNGGDNPALAAKGNTDLGVDFAPNGIFSYYNSNLMQSVIATGIRCDQDLTIDEKFILTPSADQSITGTGSIISTVAPTAKITSDGVYALTTALAAGADGQKFSIENVSANAVTLQEGPVVAQGTPVKMKYSSDQGIWEQDDN